MTTIAVMTVIITQPGTSPRSLSSSGLGRLWAVKRSVIVSTVIDNHRCAW